MHSLGLSSLAVLTLSADTIFAFVGHGAQALHQSRVLQRLHVIPSDSASRAAQDLEQRKYVRQIEEDYWKSLGPADYKFARKQALGIEYLRQGQLELALEAYDAALALASERYLWHRGLVLFFLGKYAEAATQLRRDAEVFELTHEENATDERLWALAAEQLAGQTPAVAQLPYKEGNVVRARLHTLFSVTAEADRAEALEAVHAVMTPTEEPDPMGRRFYGDIYLSLYHETQGDSDAAKRHMLAAKHSSYPQAGDLWAVIPDVHCKARNWQ